ncbi:MAG: SLATT domain-containing protein [Bacteroidaceae bacterium]|nr:SLATT domain-containing protein [Bacteroidaceae bacterium]
MMDSTRKKLLRQISDAAGNVLYTYDAHWVIVNRLKTRQTYIKITQIVLTALSTGGFLASIIAGVPWLSWVGGFTSATALGLNLYSLNFNLPSDIKSHTDAANELWDVREAYKSLLCDYADLTNEVIRIRRDEITEKVSRINKKYPGTDDKAFAVAQKNIQKYMFEEGESAGVLNVDIECEESEQ